MEKPDVSGILEKVKSGAGDLAEKARIRTAEAAGSAVCSFAGQVLIPVPVFGAVLGNAVGMILYQIAGDGLSDGEKNAGGKIPEGTR